MFMLYRGRNGTELSHVWKQSLVEIEKRKVSTKSYILNFQSGKTKECVQNKKRLNYIFLSAGF